MIYTLTLNPALDYVMRLDGPLAIGETNRAAGEPLQGGGKGINVSLVLRQLGVDSVALGFAAGRTGDWLREILAREGLTQELLQLPKGETRINVKLKGAEETEINGAGPTIDADALAALTHRLEALAPGDILVLAGSIPAGVPQDVYRRLMEPLTARGVNCVVDTTGQALREILPLRPLLVKPNRRELEALCGRSLPTDRAVIAAAQELRGLGARNVLVSLGGDGALLCSEKGTVYRADAPEGRLMNSVGAGDSMVAGFTAVLYQGGSYQQALRLGSAAGGATAFAPGLGRRDDIFALAETIKITDCTES